MTGRIPGLSRPIALPHGVGRYGGKADISLVTSRRQFMGTRPSAMAPAPMPIVRNAKALDLSIKGRDQTLYSDMQTDVPSISSSPRQAPGGALTAPVTMQC
jgi:hypothetical protein